MAHYNKNQTPLLKREKHDLRRDTHGNTFTLSTRQAPRLFRVQLEKFYPASQINAINIFYELRKGSARDDASDSVSVNKLKSFIRLTRVILSGSGARANEKSSERSQN